MIPAHLPPQIILAKGLTQWALQDSNTQGLILEKYVQMPQGAAESTAPENNLAHLVRDVLALPLSDDEKAQVIRRLVMPGDDAN